MKPYYQDNHIKLYAKDCRQMTELADNSVQCVVTSPPYWGLRKYSGEQELIWGDNHCEHQWVDRKYLMHSGRGDAQKSGKYSTQEPIPDMPMGDNTCSLCGAWKGAYGLEPTPEMYVQHTIEILREIRRVLRKDGVVFWNIGDSYASGKGTCFNPGGGKGSFSTHGDRKDAGVYPLDRGNVSMLRAAGLKPLDLCLIPEKLAIALQTNGWWVRSIIIWHKANPMPESVNGWRWERHRIKVKSRSHGTRQGAMPPQSHHAGQVPHRDGLFSSPSDSEWQDCPGCAKCSPNDGYVLRKGSWRPTDSYEPILMLTKTDNYYCDAEAVREAYQEPLNRWGGDSLKRDTSKTAEYKEIQNIGYSSAFRVGRPMRPNPSGRNLRNVWSFPTVPYPGAHFAVFPEKLPELCIKAATPEVGVCAKCGAPWARVIEKQPSQFNIRVRDAKAGRGTPEEGYKATEEEIEGYPGNHPDPGYAKTIGWRPTCSCDCPDKVPATVLDPMMGAGTTLLVAKNLNRLAVGYELSEEYCQLALERNRQQVLELT